MSKHNVRTVEAIIHAHHNAISSQKQRAFNLLYGALEDLGMEFDKPLSILNNAKGLKLTIAVKESLQFMVPDLNYPNQDGPYSVEVEVRIQRASDSDSCLKVPVVREDRQGILRIPVSISALMDEHLSGDFSATELEPLKQVFNMFVETNGSIKVNGSGKETSQDPGNRFAQHQLRSFIENCVGALIFWADQY